MVPKVCFKCGIEKPLSEFYAHAQMADGHLNKCKECAKKDVRTRYANEREKCLAYYQTDARKLARAKGSAEWQRRAFARDPEKKRARNKISNAIKNGKLQKQGCRICGEEAQAHHEDYSKPLEVDWLCFKHHREEHGQVIL